MTDTHTEALVERVALAMQNAELNDGDEGNTYRLFDLLGFSGENKAVMITRQLARAAIEALPARNDERALMLVEALRAVGYDRMFDALCKAVRHDPPRKDIPLHVSVERFITALADVQPSGETR
jgi:hypothetical protein